MAEERIDPLFFGSAEHRLFGCHHSLQGSPSGGLGVVIAPAVGHEYSRAHRALRQLARMIANGGMRALRFDLSGSGDSAGDGWPDSLHIWGTDLDLALRELALRTRVERSALVGVRLSATMALDRLAAGASVSRVVLWDPILDGAGYAQALRQSAARFEQSLPDARRESRPQGLALECMGHGWSEPLLMSLRQWQAPKFERLGNTRVLILEATISSTASALAASLERGGARVRHETSSGSEPWNEDIDRGLVPARDLARIVEFLREDP